MVTIFSTFIPSIHFVAVICFALIAETKSVKIQMCGGWLIILL